MEKILCDNDSELIKVKWDEERFAIIQEKRDGWYEVSTIILNPREMLELVRFVGNPTEERD